MIIKVEDLKKNPQRWWGSCKARGVPDRYDEIIELDRSRKTLQIQYEQLVVHRKTLDPRTHREELKQLADSVERAAYNLSDTERKLEDLLSTMPNWLAEDTPDEDSEVERSGECVNSGFCHESSKNYLKAEAAAIAGARMGVFSGDLARLELALSRIAVDRYMSAGFEYFSVPSIVREECMYNAGKLPKFAENAYSVDSKWLISTSEIPLVCIRQKCDSMHKLMSCTECYRKEAGAASRDTRGWVRQHQFRKVELVIISVESLAATAFECLCSEVAAFLTSLNLTWRKMRVCGKEMSEIAWKQIDFEVWMAGQQRWIEVASISDCKTYQSCRMNIKSHEPVHTLNGTGAAIGRLMACIVEQHYRDGSVHLPQVLGDALGTDVIVP